MKPDSEGLHAIANTDKPNREADIVFIHGLGGASHATWRHGILGKDGHFFWPEELGKDLPTFAIWSLGYPAGFTALGKPGMIIEKRAGNLSQKLANAGVGVRPIFFITHSMGGLIVKSLIVDSQTQADLERKRLVSMIRGIIFCATPHRGSAFADAAGILGKVFGGSQAHVDEMRANAESLDFLHEQFIEWHRNYNVPVQSYAENVGLFRTRPLARPIPIGLVVPRASANTDIAGHTVRDVDEDHLTLVKPSNRQHDVYAGVLRFIKDNQARNTLHLDPGVLALLDLEKERCRERGVAFFTPNILSTLLSMRGDVPERALMQAAGEKAAAEIRDALFRYLPPVDPGGVPPPFIEFAWDSREDVRLSQQRAREEHSDVVTARHLFLAVLERPSNSQRSLREKLGEEKFDALIEAVRRQPNPRDSIAATPGNILV
jgi:pimeloyl-ACP methyl ester carboxylesterase